MPKTTRRVRVALGERLQPVGELVFEADGRRQASMFRYADEWLSAAEGFAIAPTLPLSESPFHASASRERPRSALLGPIADGAPDSWGRGLLRRALPGALTELDYLLAVDDETRQGALRYLDDDGRPLSRAYPPVPRLSGLDELRRLAGAAEDDRNGAASIRDLLVGSASSLGGARPKANVRDRGGELAIAKFTSDRDTMPVERVEAATLALARAAGVNAAQARIELGSTDRPVALIRRFDRAGGDRVHYLSAQSFISADAATGAYYTDIADALRAHAFDAPSQLAELYRRVLFTILVSNNDDHLKTTACSMRAGDAGCCRRPSTSIRNRTASVTSRRASASSADTTPPSRRRWTPRPSSTSSATPRSRCCPAWCPPSPNGGGRAAGRRG